MESALNLTHVSQEFEIIGDVAKDDPLPREQAVTEFVRMKIREWVRSGKTMRALELSVGCGKGYVTVVRGNDSAPATRGISGKTGAGFARAFGFADYEELIFEAFKWWRTDGKKLFGTVARPELEPDPGKREAIIAAKSLSDFSIGLLEHTFAKYEKIGEGKPGLWWLQRANEEAVAFHAARERAVVEEKERVAKARRTRRERDRAPESSRSVAGESPPNVITPETATTRKRRAR